VNTSVKVGLAGLFVYLSFGLFLEYLLFLDAAFYTAFGNVEPAGTRLLLALDVSGSMAGPKLEQARTGLTRANPGAGLTVRRLGMLRRAGEVMLAVIDPGNEMTMPRQPDWGRESGRGLQIVGALSHVWGWSPIAGHGKAVWAVLRETAT